MLRSFILTGSDQRCNRFYTPKLELQQLRADIIELISSNTLHVFLAFLDTITLLGIIMAGVKWRFFPVNNFPRHNKNPPTQLFGFLGHDTMQVAVNMFNKFNYKFEQYMPNYINCATKGSIFEQSETKVKDKVIIF